MEGHGNREYQEGWNSCEKWGHESMLSICRKICACNELVSA